MDLSALNSSLPAGLADAERDMGEKFRAAALSITTLYKSSLACNKQAYQVGYSAALADVLSKLQSDIAAGEDAAVALARLMDWTEARQAAMAAFAADDDEVSPAAAAGSSRAHARNSGPPRPSSAPIPDRARGFGKDREAAAPGPSSLRHDAMDAEDQSVTPAASSRRPAPAPATLERCASEAQSSIPHPSSSPVGLSSISRPVALAPLRPQRTGNNRASASGPPNITIPTSTFNFSIPTTVEIPSMPTSGPAQTGPIGAKRSMVDAEMSDGTITAPSTPSRGTPGGRASKRRSLGHALTGANDGEEKERGGSERHRRPPRRGGGLGA